MFYTVKSLGIYNEIREVPFGVDSGLESLIGNVGQDKDLSPHVPALAERLRSSEAGRVADYCFVYGRAEHKLYTLSELMDAVESELSKIAA